MFASGCDRSSVARSSSTHWPGARTGPRNDAVASVRSRQGTSRVVAHEPETRGQAAEQRVHDTLRAALPPEYRLYPNVRWCAKTRRGGPAHDGEADLVVVHPEQGLLVIEVKVRRAPPRRARALVDRPEPPRHRRSSRPRPRSTTSSARSTTCRPGRPAASSGPATRLPFPTSTSRACRRVTRSSGRTRRTDIVFDADAFATPEATRSGPRSGPRLLGRRRQPAAYPLTAAEAALVDDFLAPTVELRRLLRHDIEEGANAAARRLPGAAGRAQPEPVACARRGRRAGRQRQEPDRASRRRLALPARAFGPCSSASTSRWRRRSCGRSRTRGEPPDRRPDVIDLPPAVRDARPASRRPAERPPKPIPQDWWDETLPTALEQAIDALTRASRYHAIVVDEGQDFALGWLETLPVPAVRSRGRRVLGVPRPRAGAAPRRRGRASCGLGEPLELFEDYRSPAPVSELAARFYRRSDGAGRARAGRTGAARSVEAAPGDATVEAVRIELHRLLDGRRRPAVADRGAVGPVGVEERGLAQAAVRQRRASGTAPSTTRATRSACRPTRSPTSRRTTGSSCSRRSAGSRASSARSSSCASCPRPASASTSSSTSALTRATTHLVVIAPPALAERSRRETLRGDSQLTRQVLQRSAAKAQPRRTCPTLRSRRGPSPRAPADARAPPSRSAVTETKDGPGLPGARVVVRAVAGGRRGSSRSPGRAVSIIGRRSGSSSSSGRPRCWPSRPRTSTVDT